MKTLFLAIGSLLFAATTVLAGPPVICHRVDIGNAKSLPWRDVKNWNGAEPRYDVARLTADTLALLTAATQLNVRMETLRRAAIYSVRKDGLADQLTLQLLARAANSEAEGKPMPWHGSMQATSSKPCGRWLLSIGTTCSRARNGPNGSFGVNPESWTANRGSTARYAWGPKVWKSRWRG